MSSIPNLTRGVIMQLHGGAVEAAKGSLVQVINIQHIQQGPGQAPPAAAASKKDQSRIKVSLSDGTHCMQAILSNTAAGLIQNNSLQVNNIVRLNDCIINAIGGKKVAILYSCDVVAKPNAMIGNPVDIEKSGAQTVVGGAGAAAQPPMPQRASPAMPPMPPQQQKFQQQPQQQQQQQFQQQQQRPPQVSPAPQRFANAMPQQPQQTFGQQQQQQQQQQGRFGQPAQPQQQQQQFGARPTPQPPAPAQQQQRFTGHQQQPQQQFQQQRQSQPIQRLQSGGGATSSAAHDINLDDSNFVPIRSLNPYMNSWQIKARITAKSDIKTWDKQGKAGKLFSIDLIDKDGGEIRATFFNELVDRHYTLLEPNQVYVISRGRLKYANRKFSNLPSEYEITIDDSTIIKHVTEDTSISAGHFNFVDLDQIASLDENATLDIIGIVSNPGELANIQTKAGETRAKRTITLVSCSLNNPQAANPGAAYSIDLTVWGEKSSLANLAHGQVLLCKSVKKSNFGGASVNSGPGTTFQLNPTIPQTAQLLAWYSNGENVGEVSAVTTKGSGRGGDSGREAKPRRTLLDLDGLGDSEKGDYVIVKAYVATVKRNDATYPACGNESCKGKKLKAQPGSSEEVCPTCGSKEPVHRYMLSLQLMDSFSGRWVTAFGEEAEKLLNMAADWFHNHGEDADAAVERLKWKEFVFKLRVKDEMFQGQQGSATRKKVSIFTVYPCYATSEARKLLGLVNQFEKLYGSGQQAGAAAANGTGAVSFADPQYSSSGY